MSTRMEDIEFAPDLPLVDKPDGGFVRYASELTRKSVEWVVPGRIPRGMLTLLAGDPKLGKSMLSLLWAAELSKAGQRSLMLTAEDSLEFTLKARLEALQADLDLIGWAMLRREGMEGGLSLPDDKDELERLVEADQPSLVVVDPLMAHLGDRIDSHRDHSIRRALAPLYHLAEHHGCAVVVICHLNKDSSLASVLGRVGGSIGLSGAVRSILLFARDPEDPEGERGVRRVLAHHACNVAPEAASLRFEIQPILIPASGTEPEVKTAKLAEMGECDLLASDLLRGPAPVTAADNASDWLQRTLTEEWVDAGAVQKLGAQAGHSVRTIQRTAKDLEEAGLIERERRAGQPVTMWWRSVPPSGGTPAGGTDAGGTGRDPRRQEPGGTGDASSDAASRPTEAPYRQALAARDEPPVPPERPGPPTVGGTGLGVGEQTVLAEAQELVDDDKARWVGEERR